MLTITVIKLIVAVLTYIPVAEVSKIFNLKCKLGYMPSNCRRR